MATSANSPGPALQLTGGWGRTGCRGRIWEKGTVRPGQDPQPWTRGVQQLEHWAAQVSSLATKTPSAAEEPPDKMRAGAAASPHQVSRGSSHMGLGKSTACNGLSAWAQEKPRVGWEAGRPRSQGKG